MPDNISEILDPSVNPELKELNQLLQQAVTNIENVGKAAKGVTIDFKGVKDIATLNELVAKKEEALKKMADAEDKYRSARDAKEEKALQAQIKRELDREQAAKKAINEDIIAKEQAAAREEKALAKLNNAYEQLKIKYKQAADEAKRLGAEFGVTDSRATAAAASAMKMYNSLLAVEKSVGQAQRQVGQYNTAAFAMSQILRETPAFAYSAATGFLAMSTTFLYLLMK